jgi:thiamine-phosphate pyrophosphorylase
MKPLTDCRLYAFVDTAYLRGRSPEDLTVQLCAGGADLIQLRAKEAPLDEVRRVATAVLKITQASNVGLVINDHPSLALELGADLCHLGQEDFFDSGYTSIDQLRVSDRPLHVGLSTHEPVQAERAIRAGAHYIAIGPVYPTPTKPTAKAVTLDYVRWAARNVSLPWFAIGGINLENLDEVIAAGAKRVCVVSAILNAEDVSKRCQEFKKRLDSVA